MSESTRSEDNGGRTPGQPDGRTAQASNGGGQSQGGASGGFGAFGSGGGESSGTKDGHIVSIAGPVIDVEFPPDSLPEINYALSMTVELEGEEMEIIAEVAGHIGENRVKAICMNPPDGLRRGTVVKDLGRGISVPVGRGVHGHVFNVIGEPLDTGGEKVE